MITINKPPKDDIIECDESQKASRLETCKNCEKFTIDEVTKCSECGCNISLMITYTFKECPLGKW